MKKIMVLLLLLLLATFTINVQAAADEVDQLFEDTFDGDLSKWTNPKIDPAGGGRDSSSGEWAISNGILEQTDTATSFAYLSPKGMKWKDFSITAKVKFDAAAGDDNWFGFSVRKDSNSADARYNGCNNVMVYIRRNGKVETLRGYVGGNYLDIGVDGKQLGQFDKTEEFKEYKLTVVGSKYSLSVDGKPVYEIDYPKLTDAGYISINSCISHIYIDSVKVEPLANTETPPSSQPTAGESTPADDKETVTPGTGSTPAPEAAPTTSPEAKTPVDGESKESTEKEGRTADNPLLIWVIGGVAVLAIVAAVITILRKKRV